MKETNKFIKVKVFPSSKKEKVIKNEDDSFEIYIREPAQNNLANRRVCEIIANHFTVPTYRVIIKTGHRARKKMLEIVSGKS